MALLWSRWTLDEAAADARSDFIHQNHLTPSVSNPAQVAGGAPEGSYAAGFTRASSQNLIITDASQTGLNPGTQDFSFMAWVKTPGIAGANALTIIGKGATGGTPYANGYIISLLGEGYASPRRVSISVGCSTSTVPGGQCYFAEQYPLSTWFHLAIAVDRDGDFHGWLNGAEMTAGFNSRAAVSGYEDTTAAITPNADFAIGSFSQNNAGGYGEYFDGSIDDPRYYTGLVTTSLVRSVSGFIHSQAAPPISRMTARCGATRCNAFRSGAVMERDRLILTPQTYEVEGEGENGSYSAVVPFNAGILRYEREPSLFGDPSSNTPDSWVTVRD